MTSVKLVPGIGKMEYRWAIVWNDWPGAVAEDTVRVQLSFTPKP